jgi:hypothetical protein
MKSLAKLLLASFLFLCILLAYFWLNYYNIAHTDFFHEREPGFARYASFVCLGLLVLVFRLRRHWLDEFISEKQLEFLSAPAEEVLKECQEKGIPYAIFLRSFDLEARQNTVRVGLFGLGAKYYSAAARRMEELLLRSVGNRIPVLALSNPASPFSMPGVHRFRRPGMPWIDFFELIAKDASLIIVYYTDDSPGLKLEMSLILEMGLAQKTLVILGKNVNENKDRDLRAALPQFRWVVFERNNNLQKSLSDQVGNHLYSLPAHTLYEDMVSFDPPGRKDKGKWIRYSFYAIEALLVVLTLTSIYLLDDYYKKHDTSRAASEIAGKPIESVNVNERAVERPWANFNQTLTAARAAQVTQIQLEFLGSEVRKELTGPNKQYVIFTYPELSESKVQEIATKALLRRLAEVGVTMVEFKDEHGYSKVYDLR